MAQWGRNDQAVTANSSTTKETSNGAPIGTYTLVRGDQVNRADGANAHYGNTSAGSRAQVDNSMFGNTTIGAFIANVAVGIFGISANEMSLTTGNIEFAYVTSGGSGYNANAVATLTFANGSANVTAVNAHANVTSNAGHIDLLIAQPGSTYTTSPVLTIAAPASINITANTTSVPLNAKNVSANTVGVTNATELILITSANSTFAAGDRVYYAVPASNTAIGGLTANTYYYIAFANTTGVVLAATAGGANIDITALTTNPAEVHTLTPDATFIKVTSANSRFTTTDRVYYGVPTANTPLNGFTGNTYYYVRFANTTGITLGATSTGANVKIGASYITTAAAETHTLQGDTATGYVTISGTKQGAVTHAGWVVRREGSGVVLVA